MPPAGSRSSSASASTAEPSGRHLHAASDFAPAAPVAAEDLFFAWPGGWPRAPRWDRGANFAATRRAWLAAGLGRPIQVNLTTRIDGRSIPSTRRPPRPRPRRRRARGDQRRRRLLRRVKTVHWRSRRTGLSAARWVGGSGWISAFTVSVRPTTAPGSSWISASLRRARAPRGRPHLPRHFLPRGGTHQSCRHPHHPRP